MNPQFNPTATAPTNGVYSATPTPQFAVIPITAEDAKEWLKKSQGNRRLSEKYVLQYVEDIKDGKYEVSGAAIGFDIDGVLIDGHHRLTAISRAGITVNALVGWNLSKRVKNITDTGKPRSGADMMGFNGQGRDSFPPAVVRHVLNYDRGTRVNPSMQMHKIIDYINQYFDRKLTPKHEFDLISKTPSAISAAKHLLARYQDLDKVQTFFHVLKTGECSDQQRDKVINDCRNALWNTKKLNENSHYRALRHIHTIIRVYGLWLNGQQTTKFALSPKAEISLYSAKTLRRVERTEP